MPKDRISPSVVGLLAVFLLPLCSVAEEQVAVGRYVRVATAPTASQLNPLETVVTVNFPKGQVDTIGGAARYLLSRSGYQLADVAPDSNPRHEQLLRFPLPDVQREFQLITVMAALKALGGPSYEPRIDHVERTVTYHLRDGQAVAKANLDERKSKAIDDTKSDVAANSLSVAHVQGSN